MRPSRLISVLVLLLILAVCAPRLVIFGKQLFAVAQESFTADRLILPMWIDYSAVFIFGITGTTTARVKGYDFVGAFVLAGITAMGGALLRDGLCIQCDISPLFTDSGYILSLVAAWIVGMFFGDFLMRYANLMIIIDAAGLGLYTVFGTNKSLEYGLSVPVAVGIGILNGVGGGLLRDIIARDEPVVFKPGQYYTAVAAVASLLYAALHHEEIPPTIAAFGVVILTIVVRLLVVKYDLHSRPVAEVQEKFGSYLKSLKLAKDKNGDPIPPNFFDDIDDYDAVGRIDVPERKKHSPHRGNAVDPKENLENNEKHAKQS